MKEELIKLIKEGNIEEAIKNINKLIDNRDSKGLDITFANVIKNLLLRKEISNIIILLLDFKIKEEELTDE